MSVDPYTLSDDEWCERYGETPADLARLRHEDTHGDDECQHEDTRVVAHDPLTGVTEVACEAPGCDWREVG